MIFSISFLLHCFDSCKGIAWRFGIGGLGCWGNQNLNLVFKMIVETFEFLLWRWGHYTLALLSNESNAAFSNSYSSEFHIFILDVDFHQWLLLGLNPKSLLPGYKYTRFRIVIFNTLLGSIFSIVCRYSLTDYQKYLPDEKRTIILLKIYFIYLLHWDKFHVKISNKILKCLVEWRLYFHLISPLKHERELE